MSSTKTTLLAGLVILGAGATPSFADSTHFVAPGFAALPSSEYAGWETFTTASGLNSPDKAGSDALATLQQHHVNAILTGGGNIYAGPSPTVGSYTVSYDGSGPVGEVVFQIRTNGLELDYGSIGLDYGSGPIAATRTELENVPGSFGPGSVNVTSSWSWNLTGLNATDFTINFNAAASDVSLDAARLDVAAVPEPETWALLSGVGLVAFAIWRRR